MAVLTWDKPGERLFETGVSKGVFYKSDGYGVAWNGLISIQETVDNKSEPVFFDGFKFSDIITLGEFQATMRAFTYPDEFAMYEGAIQDQDGFYIMNQMPSSFGLSYQTLVGNDINGIAEGYKIHVLWNLTALPSDREYLTVGEEIEPLEFEWDITAIPEDIDYYRPTAHVIFDSRRLDPNLLKDIEAILYGDEENDARLPSLKGLGAFIRKWDRLIITAYADGTWSAESKEEGVIVMVDDTTFEITSDTIEYLDAVTYTIESSEKNEEDIDGQSYQLYS